jgi:hypothetical protein
MLTRVFDSVLQFQRGRNIMGVRQRINAGYLFSATLWVVGIVRAPTRGLCSPWRPAFWRASG